MVFQRKHISLTVGSLFAVLLLLGCDRKADQTVPPAANDLPPAAAQGDQSHAADASGMDAMMQQDEMERLHRQAADHDAMRAGAANPNADPANTPAPDPAMPMKDM